MKHTVENQINCINFIKIIVYYSFFAKKILDKSFSIYTKYLVLNKSPSYPQYGCQLSISCTSYLNCVGWSVFVFYFMINSIQQAWNLQDRKSKEHAYITTNVSPNTITAKFSYVCCFLEIIRAMKKITINRQKSFYNV